MSSESDNQSNMPKEDASVKPTGYYIKVNFAPSINLKRKIGLGFAQKVSDYLDVEDLRLEHGQWFFTQKIPGSDSRVQLSITKNDIQLQAHFPTYAKEWFEERFRSIFKQFKDSFGPKMIVSSSTMIRGIVDVEGDARTYIATNLMKLDSPNAFQRPIHGLGIRLFLPPYQKKKGRGKKAELVNWQVNVKIESLMEDPSKLFLEADADWPFPAEWNDSEIGSIINHIADVSSFLDKTVLAYILNTPGQNDLDGDDSEGEE